ncbi:MAG: hypothetical protein K6D02_10010 [Lachnospiraceae bacterium]|nr:hypothetical protein [Lachnospiraceae bacterium]
MNKKKRKNIKYLFKNLSKKILNKGFNKIFKKRVNASLTVEASFVTPIFFLSLMTILSIIFYMGVISEARYGLYKLAYYRSLQDKKYYCAKTSLEIGAVVHDNNEGLYYAELIKAPEFMKNSPFIRAYIPMSYSTYEGVSMVENKDMYVYVAKNSKVYHKNPECTYIKPKVSTVRSSLIKYKRNNSGGKYKPCKKCTGNGIAYYVYVTEYGTRYHSDKNCNNIYHEIRRVKLSEVAGMNPCSKCSKGKGK